MKKYTAFSLSLFSTVIFCFALPSSSQYDVSSYKNIQKIEKVTVLQPVIAEIIDLSQNTNYVVLDENKKPIQQQFQTTRKVKFIPPNSVIACTSSCKEAAMLADDDERTTFDFILSKNGIHHGKIKITYAKPIETSSVIFKTTQDSYSPTAFTLIVDGKTVLNTMEGKSAHFPRMFAKDVEIDFDYTQPIRFTEVGVGSVKEEQVENYIRFVYQPNASYFLYLDSEVKTSFPSPSINLFSKNKELTIFLNEKIKNPEYLEEVYKQKDTDTDGVLDIHDNCPLQPNNDQKDSNNNGIGDLCDDYDYDGVATYLDNCPEIENPYQEDKDRDGLGDACDSLESRITERNPWMPWVVFIFVLVAVSAMGYQVIKEKRSV